MATVVNSVYTNHVGFLNSAEFFSIVPHKSDNSSDYQSECFIQLINQISLNAPGQECRLGDVTRPDEIYKLPHSNRIDIDELSSDISDRFPIELAQYIIRLEISSFRPFELQAQTEFSSQALNHESVLGFVENLEKDKSLGATVLSPSENRAIGYILFEDIDHMNLKISVQSIQADATIYKSNCSNKIKAVHAELVNHSIITSCQENELPQSEIKSHYTESSNSNPISSMATHVAASQIHKLNLSRTEARVYSRIPDRESRLRNFARDLFPSHDADSRHL